MPTDQTYHEMVASRKKSTAQRQIDENLKRVYDDVLNEEVPDKFLDLIARLKSSEEKSDGD